MEGGNGFNLEDEAERSSIALSESSPNSVTLSSSIVDPSTATKPMFNAKRSRVAADSFLDEYCTSHATTNDELDRYLADQVHHVLFSDILH